jgi:2-methylisocitrate lyase-like PEP mutase family enzyme
VLAIPGVSFAELAAAGARRVSVGGNLTWVAVKAMADAAESILADGDFSALDVRLPLEKWLPS